LTHDGTDFDWAAAAGFDVTSITGATALGATPADTDEFVLSDAGVLKRVDYSYIKSSPVFVSLGSSDSATDVANVTFENVFSDTYSRYMIYIDNMMPATGGAVLRFKYRKSDGSSGYEDEERTGYTYTVRVIKSGNTEAYDSANSSGAQTYGVLTTGMQSTTGEHGLRAVLNVYRPGTRQSSQNTMTYVTCDGVYRVHSGDSNQAAILISASNNYHTDAMFGIKFYFDTGNINDHKIRVYGVVT
jgi:hypothetical protein